MDEKHFDKVLCGSASGQPQQQSPMLSFVQLLQRHISHMTVPATSDCLQLELSKRHKAEPLCSFLMNTKDKAYSGIMAAPLISI